MFENWNALSIGCILFVTVCFNFAACLMVKDDVKKSIGRWPWYVPALLLVPPVSLLVMFGIVIPFMFSVMFREVKHIFKG